MAPALKLYYFGITGRAETARLLMAYGGIAFEDVVADWPAMKPKTPFGQLPVLEVDGKMLGQSHAINHYCAKLAGLMPEDAFEASLADSAAIQYNDILDSMVAPYYSVPEEERPAKARELITTVVKPKFEALEHYLATLPGPFLLGDKLCWADLHVFTGIGMLTSGFIGGMGVEILEPYPAIKAFHSRVGNVPAVRAHYEKLGDKRADSYRPAAM